MRISIDKVQTILSIIGEEDSIGFENDRAVQNAIACIQNKIEEKEASGQLSPADILVSFE
jgi:hypothetical protein